MSIAIGQPIPPCEVPATSQLTFSPLAAKGKKLVLYFQINIIPSIFNLTF